MADLLGPLDKNLIRVSVVDPKLGLVDNLTVAKANKYASANPGTTFLFIDGDNNLRYLSIKEVNKLTTKDLLRTEVCSAKPVPCGSPKVIISGGGGIGAAANPVISQDGNGSLLAVDVVAGGYGYTSPPRADLLDACDIGSGAVLTTEIGNELSFEEFFDEIEEYEIEKEEENYKIENYDIDGNPIGSFDVTDFFPPESQTGELVDPIQKEIEEYQKLVREIKNPWWTTRTVQPGSITAGTDSFPKAYAVNLPRDLKTRLEYNNSPSWTDFMDSFAISPVPPSNVPGSDFAGRLFVLNYEVEFPFDGEYVFRGSCDNSGKVYVDQEFVQDLGGFFNAPNVTKKTFSKGSHRIRIDLLNQPIYENKISSISAASQENFVDVNFDVYGQGKNCDKLLFTFTSEDGQHSFTVKGVTRSKTNRKDIIKVLPNVNYIVRATSLRIPSKSTIEQGLIVKDTKDKEGGVTESNKIFTDHLKSDNDNDDMQITASSGIFKSSNKRTIKVEDKKRNTYDLIFRLDVDASKLPRVSSTSASGSPITEYNVFDTVSYINKADRKLWRTNVNGRGGFANEYGVCPFDTTLPTLENNPYSGVHRIRWENINFPVDGEYDITIGVDDNVTLYIGNSSTGGTVDNNTGLRSVETGGDEYIIKKQGFNSSGVPNPVTTERISIKAGTYRIRADLEQIPGGKFGFDNGKGINPMTLAVRIKTAYVSEKVVSSKSWNQNPMGAALTIQAPEPPVPQEKKLPQLGRCPNNPIWSTRDPGAKYQWYPVEIPEDKGGNPYLNRYTMSPVKPLDTPGSDGSNKIWDNTWKVKIPFSGRYRLDGARADIARIKIDGKVVTGLTGVYSEEAQKWVEKNFAGWEDPKTNTVNVGRKSTFVNLTEGEHEITVELINLPAGQPTIIDQSIFDTKNWRQAFIETSSEYVDVEFTVFGIGAYKNLAMTFLSEDGIDSFTVLGAQTGGAVRTEKVKVRKGISYKVNAINLKPGMMGASYSAIEQGLIDKMGKKSKELGVLTSSTSVFADYIRSANDNDDIQITTNTGLFTSLNKKAANPNSKTEWILVEDVYDYPNTYHRYDAGTFYKGKKIRNGGDWNNTNPNSNYIEWEDGSRLTLGTQQSDGRFAIKVWRPNFKGRNTYDITFKVEGTSGQSKPVVSLPNVSSIKNGVTYSGPQLFGYSLNREGLSWKNFMNVHSVSPKTFDNIDESDERIVGTFVLAWDNVNFPESGQYDLKLAGDNNVILKINGQKVAETTRFDIDDPATIPINVNKGSYRVEVELTNLSNGQNIFKTNPSGVAIQITKRKLVYEKAASWKENPMGISAALVAPPCPKPGGGVGIVTNIYPIDPGNGYIPGQGGDTYNVALQLVDLVPVTPGLGYTTGPINVDGKPLANITRVGPNGEILEITTTPTIGFTSWPNIEAPEGFNSTIIPVFNIIRDPLTIEPDKLIQVVDLVGLRQTGYVNGRAYYGAVFNKDGETYAGYYETAGDLIRVYATLQESIDAQVTTEPSAIQRFGTETNINNPRLNIPNTPTSGTET